MRRNVAARCSLIPLVSLFLCGVALAVVELDTFHYERPIRVLRGRVTGFGQVVPGFWVDVYEEAKVSPDNSVSGDRTNQQNKVASAEPDGNGEFSVKDLPKGVYEVEFGNHGGGGYDVLSVLVNVDPKGTNDRLCVNLSLEGGGGKSSVVKCSAK